MKYILAILIFIPFSITYSQTTSVEYDLSVIGHSIGNLVVTRQIHGAQTVYTSVSESNIQLLGTTNIVIHHIVNFDNTILVRSKYDVWKNGKLYEETLIQRVGERYSITKDGVSFNQDQKITKSSIQLYFQKPAPDNMVFFEPAGEFKKIISKVTNEFWLVDEGKNTNNYFYSDSNSSPMKKAIIDSGFFNVTMTLKE